MSQINAVVLSCHDSINPIVRLCKEAPAHPKNLGWVAILPYVLTLRHLPCQHLPWPLLHADPDPKVMVVQGDSTTAARSSD